MKNKSSLQKKSAHAQKLGVWPGARRRGQSLVEFGLIAVIFFTMLLGLIQFGIYQSTTNTLWNLSREGARFATVSNPDDTAIEEHIKAVAPPNINGLKLTVSVLPATRVPGQSVTVSLNYDMSDKIIFPTVGNVLKKDYSTASTMRVE